MLAACHRRTPHTAEAGRLSACAGALPCDWRYAALDELRLPTTTAWLTAAERQACARFRDLSRQQAWLAGRLLAKRLVTTRLNASGLPLRAAAQIEIRSAGRRPVVLLDGRRLPWSLSITHTRRAVLVGLSCIPGISIGLDLVDPQPCGRGFAETWFTPGERAALRRGSPTDMATLWAAKEAVYKAAGRNAPFDPRAIEVDLPNGTAQLRGRCSVRECTVAAWRTVDEEIAVAAWHRIVTRRPPSPGFASTLPSLSPTPYSQS